MSINVKCSVDHRSQNIRKVQRMFCFVLFRHVFFVVMVFNYSPKWLIKVSGHIPILFGTVSELHKWSPNMDPYTPYLSQKHFKKYRNYPQTLFKRYHFCISQHSKNPKKLNKLKLSDIKYLKISFQICMFEFWCVQNNWQLRAVKIKTENRMVES